MISAIRELPFLDTNARDGEWNMRFDVERALAVERGEASPLLRVYRWDPWCISLGRHQKEEEIAGEALRRDGFGLVRRPTGGRAILHAEELTYSIVMPSFGMGIMEVYKLIGEALAAGLAKLAPDVRMAKSQPDFQKLYREPGSIPCFSSSARYEIEYEGKKIVGSAQRRFGGTVLQHGSILLGEAHLRLADYLTVGNEDREAIRKDMHTHTTTLSEAAGRTITPEETSEAIRHGFETVWNIRTVEGPLHPPISQLEPAEQL